MWRGCVVAWDGAGRGAELPSRSSVCDSVTKSSSQATVAGTHAQGEVRRGACKRSLPLVEDRRWHGLRGAGRVNVHRVEDRLAVEKGVRAGLRAQGPLTSSRSRALERKGWWRGPEQNSKGMHSAACVSRTGREKVFGCGWNVVLRKCTHTP